VRLRVGERSFAMLVRRVWASWGRVRDRTYPLLRCRWMANRELGETLLVTSYGLLIEILVELLIFASTVWALVFADS
jgi:hypothetical protein